MNAQRIALIFAVLFLLPSAVFAGSYPQEYPGAFDEQASSESINDYMSDGWSEENELSVPILGMTLREAQRRIGSREFAEWMAYYILEAEEQRGRRGGDEDAKPERKLL